MYQLFESIKVENGKALHLKFHQERVARSSGLQLYPYVKELILPSSGIYKLRISYTKEHFEGYSVTRYHPKKIKTLKLVTDNTICYNIKSENRQAIDHLFNLRDTCDDIIIVKNGRITDSSYCNILLFDGKKWYTPSRPLLNGTCRARLIKNNLIIPCDITIGDLKKYKKILLVNALLDFDQSRAEALNWDEDSGTQIIQ